MSLRIYTGIDTKNIKDKALRDELRKLDNFLRDLAPNVAALNAGGAIASKANKDEPYVVMSLSGDLDNERQLGATLPVSLSDGGAGGSATLSLDINALSQDVSPVASTDFVVTYEATSGLNKKVLLDDLPSVPSFTLPAISYGTAFVEGVASTSIRSDATLEYADALMTATLETMTVSDSASVTQLDFSAAGWRINSLIGGIGNRTSNPVTNLILGVGNTETATVSNKTDITARSILVAAGGSTLDHTGYRYQPLISGSGNLAFVRGYQCSPLFQPSGALTVAEYVGMEFLTLFLSNATSITNLTNYKSVGLLGIATAEVSVPSAARGFQHQGFNESGTPPTPPFVEYTGERWALDITADESWYHEHIASGRFPHIRLDDNVKHRYGDTQDAEIFYDGSDLVVDPRVVGTGVVSVLGQITSTPVADTSAEVTLLLNDKANNPAAPVTGSLWRNGSALNYRKDGSTTVDLTAGGGGGGDSFLEWEM